MCPSILWPVSGWADVSLNRSNTGWLCHWLLMTKRSTSTAGKAWYRAVLYKYSVGPRFLWLASGGGGLGGWEWAAAFYSQPHLSWGSFTLSCLTCKNWRRVLSEKTRGHSSKDINIWQPLRPKPTKLWKETSRSLGPLSATASLSLLWANHLISLPRDCLENCDKFYFIGLSWWWTGIYVKGLALCVTRASGSTVRHYLCLHSYWKKFNVLLKMCQYCHFEVWQLEYSFSMTELFYFW